MDEIIKSMHYGNWADAQEEFKKLDVSPNKFRESLSALNIEQLNNIALLGFYCRDKVSEKKETVNEVSYLKPYQDRGFESRRAYLEDLALGYGVGLDFVLSLSNLLGESEDFDGLISAIEDEI